MAVYIESLWIEAFRGIRGLEAGGLNHVNLIVGDNNCGKTSVLEALLLLRDPSDMINLLRVARQRGTANQVFNRESAFEGLSNLFPQPSKEPVLSLSAQCVRGAMGCRLEGAWSRVLCEPDEYMSPYSSDRLLRRLEQKQMPAEADAFVGVLTGVLGGERRTEEVRVHEYTKVSGLPIRREYLRMAYLSPADHMSGPVLSRIVKNEGYKELCLRVIQLFDPEITDLLILKNEQTNRPVEYIRHSRLGAMPVSTYGDGIKKALLLANAIAQTVNGVLMIDEIETSIHAKYYDDIFRFVLKACKQFDIQLFVTTHSMETVDALLAAQDYDRFPEREDVTVLTLQKTPERTLARVLPGREAARNREAFDFEVRL